MSHEDRGLLPERVDEPYDIVRQRHHVIGVDRLRFVTFSVAAHVRRDHPEPRLGDGPDLVAPRIPQLRKAVHQDDERSLTLDGGAHRDAVRVESLECEGGASCLSGGAECRGRDRRVDQKLAPGGGGRPLALPVGQGLVHVGIMPYGQRQS